MKSGFVSGEPLMKAYMSNADYYDVFSKAEKASPQPTEIDVSVIEAELNEWKRTGVNIAFIGNSGSGKSTLINTLRGLNADDPGAANVGTDEETVEVTPYPYPENSNVVLWDLPGVGTDNFPRDTYLSKIKFERYDFFIIVSSSRFTENDTWLVKNMVQGKEKPGCFYFVRTKIDNDVSSIQRSHPKRKYTSEQIIINMRDKTLQKLKMLDVKNVHLFLIDSLKISEYDFVKLCSCFVHDAVGSKMEAIAYTMFIRTRTAFDTKRQQLKTRIYWKALAVAAAESLPVFGYDHQQMLQDEFQFYREQFRVTDAALNTLAKTMNKDGDALRKELKLSPARCHVDEFHVPGEVIENIEAWLTASKFSAVTKTLLKLGKSLPIFYKRLCFLVDAVENAYRDAIDVNDVYQQNLGQMAAKYVLNTPSKL